MDGGALPLSVADEPDVGDPGGADHDSPTRASSRGKEKRGRPLHLYKGKTAKDKRKLREKRRSTGVLHFPASTEVGLIPSFHETRPKSKGRKGESDFILKFALIVIVALSGYHPCLKDECVGLPKQAKG